MRFAAIALALLALLTPLASAQQLTVIKAGTLIDGRSNEARRDQVIVIRGNRIESVGPASSAKIDPAANVIDLSNMTVLPGLIDTHTHIFLQGEDPAEGATTRSCCSRASPSAPRARRSRCGARWSRASRPSATWRRKARATATSA